MIDIKKYLAALNIDSSWESILKKYLLAYNITKEKDIKMFLAQTSHESLSYKRLEESFKYRPEVLIKVFPKYFKTLEEAREAKKAYEILKEAFDWKEEFSIYKYSNGWYAVEDSNQVDEELEKIE